MIIKDRNTQEPESDIVNTTHIHFIHVIRCGINGTPELSAKAYRFPSGETG